MAGAERISLDFPGRVGSVVVVGAPEPGATDPSGTASAEASRQMQELLDAEVDRVRSTRAALEAAAAQLAESREKMIQQAESQLLELAIGIAGKVLVQEIQAGRYEIEPIVREALCHVPARQDVVIRLNPDDHARCEMARQSEETRGGGGDSLHRRPRRRQSAVRGGDSGRNDRIVGRGAPGRHGSDPASGGDRWRRLT